jgi:hypothetical protein
MADVGVLCVDNGLVPCPVCVALPYPVMDDVWYAGGVCAAVLSLLRLRHTCSTGWTMQQTTRTIGDGGHCLCLNTWGDNSECFVVHIQNIILDAAS